MRIYIDADQYHTVHIESNVHETLVKITLSPREAYNALRLLRSQEKVLRDLTTNYWECHECGQLHRNGTGDCPSTTFDDAS
jgi:rubrerythrin